MALISSRSSVSVARPAARVAAVKPVSRVVLARSKPDGKAVESAIKEAEDKCNSGTTGECAAAWDNVEEISAAISHAKASEEKKDVLDLFCDDNPDADECRVYDD